MLQIRIARQEKINAVLYLLSSFAVKVADNRYVDVSSKRNVAIEQLAVCERRSLPEFEPRHKCSEIV